MPRTQREHDQLLERMRSYGHLAERSPGNIGGIFRGRDNNAGTFHASASSSNAGPPATDIWGDPVDLPEEASTLLGRESQQPSTTVGPPARQHSHSTYIGDAAGPPADDPPSPYDSGTDTDTESSDGAEQIDHSDIPVHLAEEQQAQYLVLGFQKT